MALPADFIAPRKREYEEAIKRLREIEEQLFGRRHIDQSEASALKRRHAELTKRKAQLEKLLGDGLK